MDIEARTLQTRIFFILLTALSFSSQSFSASKNGRVSLSTGTTYTSGDYGSHKTTEILYIPVSLKYKQDKWTFKLTVPYIEKTGPENIIRDIGQVGQTVVSRQGTHDGLGDIIFSAGYRLFYFPEPKILIDIKGKIKFGTADESKGLGTGENDFSTGLGLYKLVGDFTPYMTFGRKFYGESSSIKLDDVFYGSTGLTYKASKKTSIGIDLYLKQKTASSRTSTQQLSAFLNYKLDRNIKLQSYLIKGLSENTPDIGAGFSVSYLFN
jgi:hypothetical protein